jgi:hypothetical protein
MALVASSSRARFLTGEYIATIRNSAVGMLSVARVIAGPIGGVQVGGVELATRPHRRWRWVRQWG